MTAKNAPRQYTLIAEFSDRDGGEWMETAVADFANDADALKEAKRMARAIAREARVKIVDVYAMDDNGNATA